MLNILLSAVAVVGLAGSVYGSINFDTMEKNILEKAEKNKVNVSKQLDYMEEAIKTGKTYQVVAYNNRGDIERLELFDKLINIDLKTIGDEELISIIRNCKDVKEQLANLDEDKISQVDVKLIELMEQVVKVDELPSNENEIVELAKGL